MYSNLLFFSLKIQNQYSTYVVNFAQTALAILILVYLPYNGHANKTNLNLRMR